MNKWIFLAFVCTSLTSYASSDQTEPVELNDWQVEVDSSVYSPKKFEKKGVKVQPIVKKSHKPELPRKEERDKIFQQVKGLSVYLDQLDEVDKDIFYMNTKHKNMKELKKLYPKIPVDLLAKLQKIQKK